MNIFTLAFQEILYRPLLNLLVFLYQLPLIDFGLAILLLTVLIKALLWPLNSKRIKAQQEAQTKGEEFREKMKEIQEKHRDDKSRQNEEVMRLMKEMKYNPFAGFMPMIIQLVVLIALYQVLKIIIQPEGVSLLYSFISDPGPINPSFLGFLDLSQPSNASLGGKILAVLTGVFQVLYFKASFASRKKSSSKKKSRQLNGQGKQMESMQKIMQNQMIYFFPIMTIFIAWSFPAALSFYWLFSTLISVIELKVILKKT